MNIMHLLIRYVKNHKKILSGAVALAVVNQFFSLLDPQIIRIIIDRYATGNAGYTTQQFVSGLLLLLLGYVGVSLISRIAKNFQDYFVSMVTQRVGARLYADSVAHALSLPYAVFENQQSGELLKRLDKARGDAQTLITNFVGVIVLSTVVIVFVVVYAFFVHWLAGLFYAVFIPAMAATTFFLSKSIKRAQSVIVGETTALAGSTTETLRNVELVKSLGLEGQEIERLNRTNEVILGLELKKIKRIRLLGFIQGTLVNALRSTLLFLLIFLIFRGALTLGEFFSLFIYSFFIFGFLGELGATATQYQEAKASMERLQEIFDMKMEERPANPAPIGPLEELRFKNVSFGYRENVEEALHGVTLPLRSGMTVAFVGPSGSGKSTFLKLLVGLYAPTKGTYTVNAADIQRIDLRAFRSRIGYVSQETQLFAGTIGENLRFVRPEASDKDCMETLRQAAVLPILKRGSEGLDTRIGEGGVKLSGGERQRLAIARALLRDPELLIFDEATSHLDSTTERAITETIRDIERTRPKLMTVLVAHRLSTVRHADMIYVLAKGRIIEEGRHDALVKAHGLYAALWREQSEGGGRMIFASRGPESQNV